MRTLDVSKERLKSTRNIGGFLLPERTPNYPVNYVLDGQQRLSVIYAVFCKSRIESNDNYEYDLDTKVFEIYFDLNIKKFFPKEDIIDSHINVKINTFFDVSEFIKEIKELDEIYQKQAQVVQSKFQNYEIPIITTNKRSKEEYVFRPP